MPLVTFRAGDAVFEGEVPDNANLVVRAGVKRFPWPHLRYGCGMGKCAKCACRVLRGGAALPEANWKEVKQLGDRIGAGYRLMCQLWLHEDIELAQDAVVTTVAP